MSDLSLRDQVLDWMRVMGGGTLTLRLASGTLVDCCSSPPGYERSVADGRVALSPLEIEALLAGGAGAAEAELVARIKLGLDSEARVVSVEPHVRLHETQPAGAGAPDVAGGDDTAAERQTRLGEPQAARDAASRTASATTRRRGRRQAARVAATQAGPAPTSPVATDKPRQGARRQLTLV